MGGGGGGEGCIGCIAMFYICTSNDSCLVFLYCGISRRECVLGMLGCMLGCMLYVHERQREKEREECVSERERVCV